MSTSAKIETIVSSCKSAIEEYRELHFDIRDRMLDGDADLSGMLWSGQDLLDASARSEVASYLLAALPDETTRAADPAACERTLRGLLANLIIDFSGKSGLTPIQSLITATKLAECHRILGELNA